MDFRDKEPIYKQISDHFCQQILEKKWTPGDHVPSVREIAVQMEGNQKTTMRAFQLLQEQDNLVNKRGIGHFIAEDAYNKTLSRQRCEFIEDELSGFFQKINLQDFTCDDLHEIDNNLNEPVKPEV